MALLFNDELWVHYGQFYVESRTDDFFEDMTDSHGGQANGLCGAAVPGLLFLTTGLHTGKVGLTVELLDGPPPIGDEWEEVVEVSFRPATDSVQLVQWAGDASWPLALAQVDHRVRYCATGMEEARQRDTRMDDEPLLDRYLLQLWPAPAAPDEVVRQTTEIAAYWHDHARTLPPPPAPEERAAAAQREREAQAEALRQAMAAAETRRWDGHPPSERLKRINGGLVLVKLDRELVTAVEALDDETQRAIAHWAARQACTAAGLTDLDWVSAALTAVDQGASPLFDDLSAMFQALSEDPQAPQTVVASYDGRHDRISQPHAAIPAVWSAASDDPLRAALETVFHTIVTFGKDYPRLLTELRKTFLSHN